MFQLPPSIKNLSNRIIGEECTVEIFEQFNPGYECIKFATSKGLSYGIILGAMIVKLPQIFKILRSRSSKGLSFLAFVLETLAASITFAYNFRSGNPFSTYGETLFMSIQNAFILLLIGLYRNQIGRIILLFSIYSVMMSSIVIPNYVEFSVLRALQAVTIPISMLSRIPQIWTIWKHKSSGQLSALTIFLVWMGSIARVFTAYQETSADKILLVGFFLASLLNTILLVQMLVYWGNRPVLKGKRQRFYSTSKKKYRRQISNKSPSFIS